MKIGILGAGQLGRMLALAAYPLGCSVRLFDPTPQSSAGALAPHQCAHYDDLSALEKFARGVDVVSYEFENVPLSSVRQVAQFAPIYPGEDALAHTQERFAEKRLFATLGVPCAESIELPQSEALTQRLSSLRSFGTPCVLKTRRLGYDGKGQLVVREESELEREEVHTFLEAGDVLVERLVSFTRELSLISVRSTSGEMVFYPLVENVHHEGILRTSRCPSTVCPPSLQAQAEEYAESILTHFSYVGVMTIEFFEVNGKLFANEIAPRVHNSGHWSIEGAVTSQFENHVRAVCGLPLGSTEVRGAALMVNLIGYKPELKTVLALKDTHFHWYGKVPRPGRKVGHVTALFRNVELREKQAPSVLIACKEPAAGAL